MGGGLALSISSHRAGQGQKVSQSTLNPRQHHPIAGEVRRVCSSLVPEKSQAPATPKSLAAAVEGGSGFGTQADSSFPRPQCSLAPRQEMDVLLLSS